MPLVDLSPPGVLMANIGLWALAHASSGWTVRGLLTVHGVTSPVTVRLLDGRQTEGGCAFTAAAVVDRTAFGVRKLVGPVARELTVIIEVVATSAS